MRSPVELFTRLVRKTHRDTRLPMVALALGGPAPGKHSPVAYAVEGLDAEQLEHCAAALLSLVSSSVADTEATCPCCKARGDRIRAALAALDVVDAEPVGSVH